MNGKKILNWIIATGVIAALIGFIQIMSILIDEPFLLLEVLFGLVIFTAFQYVIVTYFDKESE